MGQKTHPIGFRLGVVRGWTSKWYSEKDYSKWLHEDLHLKKFVKQKLGHAGVASVEVERAANDTVKRVISLQQGIPTDAAREIVRHLKDLKLKKVQAAIQGDQLRITSPSKDDLQGAMQALRAKDFGIALQFGNYR